MTFPGSSCRVSQPIGAGSQKVGFPENPTPSRAGIFFFSPYRRLYCQFPYPAPGWDPQLESLYSYREGRVPGSPTVCKCNQP